MRSAIPASPRDFFHQHGRGTGAGSASDQQIRLVLRYGGLLDLPLLRRAIRAVVDGDPILRARLVEPRPFEGYWELRDGDAAPECELEEVEPVRAGAAEAAFLADLEVRDQGPYFRVRVVRAGGRDALCLRVDHRLCDGGGTKLLAYRLAGAYRRLAAGEPLPPPLPDFQPRTVAALTGRALPPPRPPPPPDQRLSYALPRRGFENERPAHTVRVLEAAAVAALRRAGKAFGATLTDLLLTALARALAPHWVGAPGAPLVLATSADVRSRLPPGTPETLCNLFQALFPGLRHDPARTFPAALAETAASMSRIRAGLTLESALQGEADLPALARRFARFPPPSTPAEREETFVLLSNVGILDADLLELGAPPLLDAQLLGTIALGRELLVSASSFRGALTLSTGACASDLDPAVPEGILDRLMAELRVVAGEG